MRSPLAFRPLVIPLARAVIPEAVTSPPRRERELIWLDAVDVAFVEADAEADAESEPVVTIEPSLGYANPPAEPTLSGGAEANVDEPPACPGTMTLIPYAFALAVG
jgi:hypothetical protein